MADVETFARGKVVYDLKSAGLRFLATYGAEQMESALVEIFDGGERIRAFLYPAYRAWNIAAHADDLADEILAERAEAVQS